MRKVKVRLLMGSLALLAIGALAIACGGGGDDDSSASNQPSTQPAPQVTTKLFLDVDVVRGPEGMTAEEKTRKSCTQSNLIPLGGQVVWRVRVYDPKTGNMLDDKALASVVASLPDGQSFPMKYGAHPKDPPGESFWTSSFKVPATYAVGVLDYKVVATDKEGRTGEFKQIMSVPAAVLTIVATEPMVSIDAAPDAAFAAAR